LHHAGRGKLVPSYREEGGSHNVEGKAKEGREMDKDSAFRQAVGKDVAEAKKI